MIIKERFAKKIVIILGDLTDKILILGWAFKANTNDSRESAAIYVTEKLFEAGAEIKIYDPKVPKSKISNDIFEYWQLDPNRLKNKIEISEIKNFKSNSM